MTRKAVGAALLLLVAFVGPVFAHPHHAGHEMVDGLAHPWFGLDHLLAMVGVGLLAARLGGRALWLVPAAFLSAMLLGAVVSFGSVSSFGGVSLAQAAWWGELGVMLSVAVFGLLLARKRPIAITGCLALVAGFALFHGYAHAAEAAGTSHTSYLVGMIAGTAMLHAVGLTSGLAIQRLASERYVRLSGKAITALGVVLLLGQLI